MRFRCMQENSRATHVELLSKNDLRYQIFADYLGKLLSSLMVYRVTSSSNFPISSRGPGSELPQNPEAPHGAARWQAWQRWKNPLSTWRKDGLQLHGCWGVAAWEHLTARVSHKTRNPPQSTLMTHPQIREVKLTPKLRGESSQISCFKAFFQAYLLNLRGEIFISRLQGGSKVGFGGFSK